MQDIVNFADFDLDKVPEIGPMEAGMYNLVVLNARRHISKSSGKPSIMTIIGFVDHPEGRDFMNYFSIPTEDDNPRNAMRKMSEIKTFVRILGLPSDCTTEDWKNCEFEGYVTLFDGERGPQNGLGQLA